MNVDLFCKTWRGDREWLGYALRSVKRFATGFRQLVIVVDDMHDLNGTLDAISLDMPIVICRAPEPPPGYQRDPRFPNSGGVGYVWQMGVKWSWPNFTDADAVVMMDSDYCAKRPFSPNSFTWQEGKRHGSLWVRRAWKDRDPHAIEHVWRPAVEYFAKRATVFDYLVDPAMYYTRAATLGLHRYLLHQFGQTPYEYVMDRRHPQPTEHGCFGAFVNEIEPIYDYRAVEEYNSPWLMSWSWGGLTPAIRAKLEQILA